MTTRVASVDEVYNAFPFKASDLTLEPRRPTGTAIRKLIKGMKRNARSVPSHRLGCRGPGMGHKWLCMQESDWITEQTTLAQKQLAKDHASWATRRALVPQNLQATWDASNPEPNATNAAYQIPAFPEIDNPGELEIPPGATAPRIGALVATHQTLVNRFTLESNVHHALKKLFIEMVPQPLYSDKIGDDDEDVDIVPIHELLAHLEHKCDRMSPQESDKVLMVFHSPMGDLTAEQYFTRQVACQNKLRKTALRPTDAQIKNKAIVHFNNIPWMQKHVTAWEDEVDPSGAKTLDEFRTCFIKKSGRHYDNQAALKEAGMCNNVADKADRSELTIARARISDLESLVQAMTSDVETIANAVLSNDSSSSDTSALTYPTQTNQVNTTDAMLQTLLSRMSQIESKVNSNTQGILTNATNSQPPAKSNGSKGRKPIDNAGRVHSDCCPNCGVQLSPGKCANGCIRIQRGHRNLPFPTQAEADKVTFATRTQFPRASDTHANKWGKEWSQVTDPRIVAQAPSARCPPPKRLSFHPVVTRRCLSDNGTILPRIETHPLNDQSATAKQTERHMPDSVFHIPTANLMDERATSSSTAPAHERIAAIEASLRNPWHHRPRKPSRTVIADSGTNVHIVTKDFALHNERPSSTSPATSASENGISFDSKGECTLGTSHSIPITTEKADVNESLLGLGDLATKGCVSILDNTGIAITKQSDVTIDFHHPPAIKGTFDRDKLWRIPIDDTPNPVPPSSAVPVVFNAHTQRTQRELIEFLHGCAGCPVRSTWVKAVKAPNHFATWPGLTVPAIRKHLDLRVPTVMGHMTNIRSGTRSTRRTAPRPQRLANKLTPNELTHDGDQLAPPRPHPALQQGHAVTHNTIALDDIATDLTGPISSDLPGRFPIASFNGNNCIFLLYDHDSNAILAHPIKSRHTKDLLLGCEACCATLREAGMQPVHQRLDNEAPDALCEAIKAKNLRYQSVTAHDHRTNPAERAIRTFKDHFAAILNGADQGFPAGLWDELIPQSVITLNSPRPSRINPRLSACHQIFGEFDFNGTPLAPSGTKGVVCVDKTLRPSAFADHGKEGWCVGPCMNKCRNYKIWVDDTHGTGEHSAVAFFPIKTRFPNDAPLDRISATIEDLLHELSPKPDEPTVNSPTYGTPENQAIRRLRECFRPSLPGLSRFCSNNGDPQPPPRVSTTAPSPRVPPANARSRKCSAGANIHKQFIEPATGKPRVCKGNVVGCQRPCYRIRCDDADEEEMTPTQVARCAVPPRQANHATRGYQRAVQHVALKAMTKDFDDDPFNQTQALHKHIHKICAVTHCKTGKQMEYRQLIRDPHHSPTWRLSFSDEAGNLFQGIGKNPDGSQRAKGTNTCFWTSRDKIPKGRVVTFARIVCDCRPQKIDRPNRTRITACGNLITDHPHDVSTETAGPETIKIHWNSTMSTPGARCMTIDISNMHLNAPLDRCECMKMHLRDIPDEVIEECDLKTKADSNGWCHIEARKAIPGLKQSGLLAHNQLRDALKEHGHCPSKHTCGPWLHKTRDISFTLVVDDFGVKHTDKADADHLLKVLEDNCPIKADWTGDKCIGIDLAWDCENRTVTASMKGCVKKALLQFTHETPAKPCHAPSQCVPPQHGKKTQHAEVDKSTPMTATEKQCLQQICGKFLHCARAVDDTMLHALNELASRQSDGAQQTIEAMLHFLNYAATNPNAEKCHKASDMMLTIDSDAAHLVAPKARSRAGGFLCPGNEPGTLMNGSIAVIEKIMKNVASSAAEAEVAALFMNAQLAAPLRTALEELGHPQPPTPMKTDNTTANGITNGTVKQQRSKAIDMRFCWLKDRVELGQFKLCWAPGDQNWADCFTKHHSPTHHKRVRPIYLKENNSPRDMQGCLDLVKGHQPAGVVSMSPEL